MKYKFNIKLTAFLVSLFLGLLLLILGSKNSYCLSFGALILAASFVLYVFYNNEKIDANIRNIEDSIDEVSAAEDIEIEDLGYILKELKNSKNMLLRRKKRVIILFYFCAILLVIVAFANFI